MSQPTIGEVRQVIDSLLAQVRAGRSDATSREISALERARVLAGRLRSEEPGILLAAQSPDFAAIVALAEPSEDQAAERREVSMEAGDLLGWFGAWRSVVTHRDCAPFVQHDSTSVEILEGDVRIAIVGDWGSGAYGAPVIASTLARSGPFDAIIHLGDVYWLGRQVDFDERFLPLIVPLCSNGSRVRLLNGNHEMWSGGGPYFRQIARLGQRSSYFALVADCWILVGLDTAFKEWCLTEGQFEFIHELLSRYPGRNVVFMSHHQPFSVLETVPKRFVRAMSRIFDDRRVSHWYWGHEHRAIVYEPHQAYGFRGRCVGHGGFPERATKKRKLWGERRGLNASRWFEVPESGQRGTPSAAIWADANPDVPGGESYAPHGFAIIELSGESIRETFHNARGEVVWTG